MIKINKFFYEERAQMMTIEAFLGALLIVGAIFFVVSQAPSSIQQSNPHSNTQLYHTGEDVITLLQTNTSPDPYFDNLMQYYIGVKKFDELDSYIENVLPKNIGYNIEMHDGRRSIPIIQNDYPTEESITINKMVAIKLAPMSGIGALSPPWYFENRTFGNGSLIIPMDKNQTNNITTYNLIMKISSELRIPVYQLMQDPRDDDYIYWGDLRLNVTVDPWNASSGLQQKRYAGGPYVIDAADLDQSMRSDIKYWAENPIDVPSSKIDKIEFDSDISGNVNITFRMDDSSTRTINLSRNGSNIVLINDNSTGNDSEFLDIDTTSISFADDRKDTIIGLVMFNTGPTDINIKISNITIDSSSSNFENITIEGEKSLRSGSGFVEVNHDIIYNDPYDKVTVNRAGEEFSYEISTWLTRAPKIAVYPKAGTMMNYYSDSGISFEVLNSSDLLNGKLKNYDFLFMPHVNATPMSENETINIIDWVSSGGVLLAECDAIRKIEVAMGTYNPYNHTWDGFIGVNNGTPETDVFQFIGDNPSETNHGYYFDNLTGNKGAFLHPLAQSYTTNGALPLTNGTIASFKLANNFSLNNSIMAVPQGNSEDDLYYPKIIYIEAPFEKGTVVYLAGHDQSLYSQQRERLIFNSIFYSTTAKVYQYGLTEIQITMWYK